jgi:hypothetical protein
MVKIIRGDRMFDVLTKRIEMVYRFSKILEDDECLCEEPDAYWVLMDERIGVLGTSCIFDYNLPVEKNLIWNINLNGARLIEIGRLAFFSYNHVPSILESLVGGIYQICCSRYGYFSACFCTHNPIKTLIEGVFGPDFLIPVASSVNWPKVEPADVDYYKKIESGDAGLYFVNQEVIEKKQNQNSFRSYKR